VLGYGLLKPWDSSMTQARDLPSLARETAPYDASVRPDLRESGIVPARKRGAAIKALPPALVLHAPRSGVSAFGSALAGASELLLVGGRLDETTPFATLYRRTENGFTRERLMHGVLDHRGPTLATDGVRVLVGQARGERGERTSFGAVYRRNAHELELEATLEPRVDDAQATLFGERAAIGHDLLVLGHSASLCVYRHSAVGWLSTGLLKPPTPYAWNPLLGHALGVLQGRVLVGNPVELEGHRAGPGRVFAFRSRGDHMQLESVLSGDGIECGREESPSLGFGASIHVADDLVAIGAPHELASDGTTRSRIYVYRAQSGALTPVARVDVPSCDGGVCIVGDRLFCLGDALYVFARRGPAQFVPLGSFDSAGASSLTACGPLVALAAPSGAGKIALHFVAQF
jgi:hypothetical protein